MERFDYGKFKTQGEVLIHFISDSKHPSDVLLRLDGDWESEEQAEEYAKEICEWLNSVHNFKEMFKNPSHKGFLIEP